MPNYESKWHEAGELCLDNAIALLKDETAPAAVTAEAVKTLIEAAVSIDLLNLRWEEQSRCGAAVFRGQPFSQQAKEN